MPWAEENHMVVNALWPDEMSDDEFPMCDCCGEIITDAKFIDMEPLTLHRHCLLDALKDRRKQFGILREYAAEYITEDDSNIRSLFEWRANE